MDSQAVRCDAGYAVCRAAVNAALRADGVFPDRRHGGRCPRLSESGTAGIGSASRIRRVISPRGAQRRHLGTNGADKSLENRWFDCRNHRALLESRVDRF